eukprot:TRINITY_DN15911_c0_g1_i1.p1 TRINITY_DN15911_c0_g1~~TRINITY_DN15911_c0_g1_i1.p1  ORF type:complete len:309 (+),score=83.82 TRINITY_DN15911_c0_g1_i1:62-928(+)
MGPKTDRASKYEFDNNAFAVTREEAIEWVNKVLENDFEDVEDMAMRGSEWCQLVHYCTIPEEGIIDLQKVHFGKNLSKEQIDENYAVLQTAFDRLSVQCPFLEGKEEQLKSGCYSESIDFLHWMKHFVEYMGAPMYFHAKDDREDIIRQHEERVKAAETAKKAQDTTAPAKRTVRSTMRTTRHPAVPKVEAVSKVSTRRLRDTTNQAVPRAAARVEKRAPSVDPSIVESYQRKIAELEADINHKHEILQRLATNFDKTVKNVNHYLASTNTPPEVQAQVSDMLMNFMS